MQADRGFAFVKLDSHENAALAIVNLQGTPVHGRQLKCHWGKDRMGGDVGMGPGASMGGGAVAMSPQQQPQQQVNYNSTGRGSRRTRADFFPPCSKRHMDSNTQQDTLVLRDPKIQQQSQLWLPGKLSTELSMQLVSVLFFCAGHAGSNPRHLSQTCSSKRSCSSSNDLHSDSKSSILDEINDGLVTKIRSNIAAYSVYTVG